MRVRAATPAQHAELLSVLDGAALQTDSEQIRNAIDRGDAFVAHSEREATHNRDETPPVLGGLVLDGSKIVAVAVRPGRRGHGIGRALVTAAKGRRKRLVMECEPSVRQFWEAVGFELSAQDNRLTGEWRE
jgi:GNAT superfamily N-acetyltransferase